MQNLLDSSYFMPFVILVALWTIPWKGIALWRSAKNGSKMWFIFLLLFNTLAIAEIVYIFVFSKRQQKHKQAL
ncbi:MAG TPA: DUF5652 family protein [Candidatus Moranbacteria bacterium]|nr:DUF5652 family protein [Candidatus Moranbacteria bacterium]